MIIGARALVRALTFVVCTGSSAVWAQCNVELLCPDDGHANADFGVAVDVRNGHAVIGAVRDSSIGACYVATKGASGWTVTAKLVPESIAFDRLFGSAVGIDGDWVAVAALLEDPGGTVRMFRRGAGAQWVDEGHLLPADLDFSTGYGFSLDLDGATLVVSAVSDDEMARGAGAVYVFELENDVWVERSKLFAPAPAAGDEFGSDLALDGDRLLVGARSRDTVGADSGAAYVFERDGSEWSFVAELMASDPEANALFGEDVALLGDRAIVGSYTHGLNNAGAAYVFIGSGSVWSEESRLSASDAASNDNFGKGVDLLSDRRAVVGAWSAGSGDGAAYVFARDGTTWNEVQILSGGADEAFGAAIAADGPDLLVGAFEYSCQGNESGAVYTYDVAVVRYCETSANSVGPGALIDVLGSTSVSENAMSLRAGGLPPGRFGAFCYGPEPDHVPLGSGVLCIGAGAAGIQRLYPAATSAPSGELVRAADFSAPPMNGGPGQITVGSTWYFQLWYRDVVGSNLTDAVQVVFCP